MNPTLKLIFSRRSVRDFAAGDVPEAAVRDMLEAAMAAPSAACKDPWEFIVVRDPIMREEMAEGLPNGKFLNQAAVGIVVCGNLEKAHAGELSYLLQDCSAAIENLLLAANAMGYGACWLGVHPRSDRVALLRTLLDIPDHVVPVGAVAIGVPKDVPPARTRFREDAVHQEKW
jgi:nitroreductase